MIARLLLLLAIALSGVDADVAVAGATAQPPSALAASTRRIIFDEAVYWAGRPEEVREVLDRVAAAGFNTYIPCVWHGQGAIWPSQRAPLWHRNRPLAKRDPLPYFIEQAHARGIEVHPCFTVVLREHDFLPEFTSGTGGGDTFNIHNPDFRDFAADIVAEVAARYDVDGVHLDYVRAGEVCYDPACQKNYRALTGRALLADLAMHKVNGVAKAAIVGWQRQAMTALIKRIADRARTAKPGIDVSVAAAPWAESVVIEGQQSLRWAELELVDWVLSMNYQDDIPWEQLSQLRSTMRDPQRLLVMVANYRKNNGSAAALRSKSGSALREAVDRSRTFHPLGSYAVYLYSMLTSAQIEALAAIKDEPQDSRAARLRTLFER